MKHGRTWAWLFLLTVVATTTPAELQEETIKIDIPNALVIADRVLAGGQPDEDQLRQAAEAGFRTIVNLRPAGEEGELADEAELVRALNMDYIVIPVTKTSGINEENARKLADILADAEGLPAMVHCRSGNRIGILLALKGFALDGMGSEEAMEYGKSMGMRKVPARLEELLGIEPGE